MRYRAKIPNILTFIRALATPIAIAHLVNHHFRIALFIYCGLAITDLLDGYLARRWKAVSSFGALMDQVCDKLVGVGFFTALMFIGACPAWFGSLVISIAVLQTLGFIIHHLPGHGTREPLESLRIGKINMALQYTWIGLSIALQMLPESSPLSYFFHRVETVGYSAMGLLQVTVFLFYFQHYRFHPLFDLRALIAKR